MMMVPDFLSFLVVVGNDVVYVLVFAPRTIICDSVVVDARLEHVLALYHFLLWPLVTANSNLLSQTEMFL
jgi:hypothetical protein